MYQEQRLRIDQPSLLPYGFNGEGVKHGVWGQYVRSPSAHHDSTLFAPSFLTRLGL